MTDEFTPKVIAAHLRQIADKVEAGAVSAVAMTTLEKCDDCPHQHGHLYVGLEPERAVELALPLMGVVANLAGYTNHAIEKLVRGQQVARVMAVHEAKRATKQ